MLKAIYLALLTTTGSALLLTSGSQGVGVQDRTSQRNALESQYQRLEKLTFTILKKGTTSTIDTQLRQIRDFFRTRGNLGARFLIEKLEAMNEDETRFLKGSDDPMRGLGEYVGYQVDHGRSNLTKYAVSNMLADMYGTLSPGTQAAVLKTITASYTPSTWGGHDIGALHWALLRIGPAAITYMLQLANHQSELVRCSSSEVLKSVGKDLAQQPTSETIIAPPELACHATNEERSAAIEQWTEWWEKIGRTLPFPPIESFFDTATETIPRGLPTK